MYNVIDVCRYIINYSNEHDYSISNLKLQKLLYFVQAVFLCKKGEKCFREPIEAWDFGPVVPEAYREFKNYGGGEIPQIKSYFVFDENVLWNIRKEEYNDNIINREDKRYIDAVINKFSDYAASDLVELTHNQSPWIDAYRSGKNSEITPEAIEEFFGEHE